MKTIFTMGPPDGIQIDYHQGRSLVGLLGCVRVVEEITKWDGDLARKTVAAIDTITWDEELSAPVVTWNQYAPDGAIQKLNSEFEGCRHEK